ncbi:hypothetical protein A5784_14240 [Mycobacterium sp. 852013-50091_SCH5140682]|uniref:DUF7257 domain-containing protein n=1 Tax=Mycobacterium sp. 852013-50091_SCH5140682 TaxID=1834109 RepID=UPI0007EC21ED|nr:hypothetical protein [Mycobacterium sp. 852013-50091_SCH5140682]OBC03387.1 hypothetical protein A5784_14240 [Mycobacterium sp. 852013-50091_SCH5140682]
MPIPGIVAIKRDGQDIVEIRRDGQLVWSTSSLGDYFDRDTLGANWVHYGPASDYVAGIVDGSLRLDMPDGLVSAALKTDRVRLNTGTTGSDDYYLEFRIGSQGSGNSITNTQHRTQVFARVSNGAFTHGVGVELINSKLAIVRRVANVDTIMVADCGAYAAGDICRLTGVGNLHTLRRNGAFAGEWPDNAATAAKGAGYRSIGARVDASKDLLGPRRFSPSIDWINAG